MTHRLILIRHAKSDWSDPFADDHARMLNRRGRASATAIGQWIMSHGYLPDVILCSDAARTKETCDLIIAGMDHAPKVRFSPDLYLGQPSVIQTAIVRQDAPTVAVIGHNPGLGLLANALVASPPDHHRFQDYPTCATTVMDFAIDTWRDIAPKTGRCIDFMVPRDLIGTTGEIQK